ncbi:meiosis-specific with OB domain-containing protein [Phymastichus coffea]|uniref:meiosis-specific with OB domain-containing protein n=1 Tax=Phymastichus coffea TaxID=108790 RepID=UPI00273AEC35|nr:meiosis-specific with OB domain-containing protein [Phymastichus coffea]
MANVSRQPIASLQSKMQNTIIIGAIIRSQNSKIIDPTRARYNMESRAVWNFTLRDTIDDFINVAVWGTVDYINKLFTTFHIGSIVEVINAKITERKPDDPNEVYVPTVSSPYTLTLSQNSSLIQMHTSPASQFFQNLLHLPTKDPAGTITLAYILENNEMLKNQFVDVLVGVTFVSQTREIVTRQGELTKIREFEVGDGSTEQIVSLTLWDSEWIKLADQWQPKQTILFLADAQITYNSRIKKSALTIVRKTVITENPHVVESKELRAVLQSKPEHGSMSPFAVPNPNSITKQMTIREITARINCALTNPTDERMQLLVAVTTIIDDMNLDSTDPTVISARCAKCKKVVSDGKDSCMNLECPFGNGIKSPMNVMSLNIMVTLRDDSGYLVGCRLKDAAAETVLGCTADVLKDMPREERMILKEKYVDKLCTVRMQILGPSAVYEKPIYNILAIDLVELKDDRFEPFDIEELNSTYDEINH